MWKAIVGRGAVSSACIACISCTRIQGWNFQTCATQDAAMSRFHEVGTSMGSPPHPAHASPCRMLPTKELPLLVSESALF